MWNRRARVSDRDNDKDLMGKACRGDEAAFLLLYQEHREPIFRFAYRMLGSIEAAEDITHECFLSLIVRVVFDGRRPESIIEALHKDLGLELQRAKRHVEVLVAEM